MLGLVLAIAITLGIVMGLHAWWLQSCEGLYANGCYLILDSLYLLLIGELIVFAFLLSRKQASWRRAAHARGSLVAASFVFLVSAADLYVILLRFDTSGPGGIHCLTHRNWFNRIVSANQLGYWERDLAPYLHQRSPGDRLVIAAVGDSFTWGQGAYGAQYRFSNLLEKELQAISPVPVTVLNFGHGGKDTKEELLMLEDVAQVHPDIVMLCYLSNDIGDYIQLSFTDAAPPCTFERWLAVVEPKLTVISPTYNFVYWKMRAPRQYRQNGNVYYEALYRAYRDPTIMSKHLQDVEALIARIRAMHAQPVFVVLPFPSMWQEDRDASGAKRALRDQVYATLTQRVQSLGVPVIDAHCLEDEMSLEEFAVNAMDAHPNAAAHQRISQILTSEYGRQELLQKTRGH